MKNELIITDEVNQKELRKVITFSKEFFESELQTTIDLVETKEGFDLEYKGIELGSYGIRSCEYLTWIYATGCAEPRMSIVKNIIKHGLPLKRNT